MPNTLYQNNFLIFFFGNTNPTKNYFITEYPIIETPIKYCRCRGAIVKTAMFYWRRDNYQKAGKMP
jgi:hypothetical protein